MYNLLHLSGSQTTTQAACVMPLPMEHVHSGKQVPVKASGFMAGSEPTIKRTAVTKYDLVPFVHTKEPLKIIGSFASVTSLPGTALFSVHLNFFVQPTQGFYFIKHWFFSL